jgi:hypothetical protein
MVHKKKKYSQELQSDSKMFSVGLSLLNIIDSYSHSGTNFVLKFQGTSKTVLHFWQYKLVVLQYVTNKQIYLYVAAYSPTCCHDSFHLSSL